MNEERIVAEFCELVQIQCSSKAEREVAAVVKEKLETLGLDVFEDDVAAKINGNSGNIIGYLKGTMTAPVLMLSAHLDSVEPCGGIVPKIDGGVITSSGNTILGGDDKAGVVAILEGLRIIKEKKIPHGDIQVVFSVAEENGLNGSKYIERSLLKADFGYVLDSGGSPGKIINTAPGQNNIQVTVHGKTAHAGVAPEEGINAIIVAGKALAELSQGRIDEETTANVGIIKGGHATNIVPDLVEIDCEARSRDLKKLEKQTQDMVEVFTRVAAANGAKVEIVVDRMYDPYLLAVDLPLITLAAQAAVSIGLEPIIEGTGGGSDANYFNTYGVPSAVLGVGMSKVHTTDEYIKIDDLKNAAELVMAIVQKVAGLTK